MMPYLQRDDASIYYELTGSGPPLVLIAGLASDSQSWQLVTTALAEQFTLIMPDNRGAGRSTQSCPISISLMADDCMALLTELGIDRACLLGHSMGGMVAMECAIRYPGMVDRLVLAATAARNSSRNNLMFSDWADRYDAGQDQAAWLRTFLYWIFTARFFNDAQQVANAVRWLISYPWPQSNAAFRLQVEALAAFDATSGLSGIYAPALLIAGEEDILIPAADMANLQQQIPDCSLTLIRGAAHSIHSEQPEAFVDVVKRWVFGGEEPLQQTP